MQLFKRRVKETCDALLSDAMTPFMLTVVGLIFAVELAANIANESGVIAMIHLTVIGILELAIVGLLGTAVVRKAKSVLRARSKRIQANDAS